MYHAVFRWMSSDEGALIWYLNVVTRHAQRITTWKSALAVWMKRCINVWIILGWDDLRVGLACSYHGRSDDQIASSQNNSCSTNKLQLKLIFLLDDWTLVFIKLLLACREKSHDDIQISYWIRLIYSLHFRAVAVRESAQITARGSGYPKRHNSCDGRTYR